MNDSIIRKSQELCFALLRIAAHIRRYEMRKTLERLTYHLLENVSYQNAEMSLGTISAIRNFVILGKNIYEVEPVNAKILERELDVLSREIRLDGGLTRIDDLDSIFTKHIEINRPAESQKIVKQKRVVESKKTNNQQFIPEEVIIDDFEINYGESEMDNAAMRQFGNDNAAIGNMEESNSAMRQDKIFIMLSTAPEKRLALKELIAAFPEVSERTIRYDLKKLTEEGRVIRQGSGGPSSYYTAQMSALPDVINL